MMAQQCLITGLPAGHPDACNDCDPCLSPGCWTDETRQARHAFAMSLARKYEGEFGCLFPSECCMPTPHFTSECHTAEMMEKYLADDDQAKEFHSVGHVRSPRRGSDDASG